MNKYNDQKGSVLILVMMGIVILSLIGVMGLNKSKTEITISRNFYSEKTAFFAAETGINTGKNFLRNSLDPATIIFGPVTSGLSAFRSGKLYDRYGHLITAPQYVTPFTSFPSPPPTGMTLDPNMGLFLTSWELSVTAESSVSTSDSSIYPKSKREITTTIAILLSEY